MTKRVTVEPFTESRVDDGLPAVHAESSPERETALTTFSRHPDLWCVALILAIVVPLNFVGIGWGLPNHYSYAQDAISPIQSLDALDTYPIRDSGWCSKYPLAHYLLTGLIYQPYLLYLDAVGRGKPFRDAIARILATDQKNLEHHFKFLQQFVAFRPRMTNLLLMGASLSALMGIGAVLLIYLIGRQLAGRLAGLLAAVLAASYGPTVYHAHTLNVDIPYVFWLCLCFWCLLRAIIGGRALLFVATGAAGALAFATKDQAYGVLAAVPLLLLLFWKRPGTLIRGLPSRPSYPWRQVALALATFVLVYAAANNWFLNWHGFKEHIRLITHEGVEPFAVIPGDKLKTGQGQLDMMGITGSVFRDTLPTPILVLLGAGVAIGLVLRAGPTLFFALPALTYYASFIAVIGYCYARFLIPIIFFAALPAGRLLAELRRVQGKLKWVGAAIGIGCLVLALESGGETVMLFLKDPRDAANQWMHENLSANDRVMILSDMTFTAPAIPDEVPFHVVNLAHVTALPNPERAISEAVREFNPTYFIVCCFKVRTGATLKEFQQKPVEFATEFAPPPYAEALQKMIYVSPTVTIYRVVEPRR